MTQSTASIRATGQRRVPAAALWAGALVTGAFGSLLFEEIERRHQPEHGYGDVIAVLLFGVLTSLIVIGVSTWAARAGDKAARRTAITMAVLSVLTLPLFYWSGMPAALGLGAYLAVRSRPVEGAARVAAITGAVVALAVSALAVVTGLVSPPWN
ncbi:MAG TPA: hypothetical protein VFX41_12775 [Actinomycetales bacterium]|nr:hypothetical protein [Actinomycetales bacterium]